VWWSGSAGSLTTAASLALGKNCLLGGGKLETKKAKKKMLLEKSGKNK
jgi:hypothetical protein